MSSSRSARACLLAALANGSLGCASTPAPARWLPTAREAASDSYGGWIVAEQKGGSKWVRVEGELIAIDAQAVHILSKHALVTLRTADVDRATVAGYQPAEVGAWAGLGVLSTLSHGWFLLLSAPVWALTGAVTGNSEKQAALAKYPQQGIDALRLFARFPQGLPAGLDPETLVPRTAKPVP